ncbi:MAG: hypothetical protein ABSF94_09685 [Steroidobacteraceae bacterium]|jgi:hypothetical protein
MSSRAELHAARRMRLVARSERLREAFGADAAAVAVRLKFADKIAAAGRSGIFKVVLAGAAALLLSGRAGRIIGLASRLAMLYPLLRRAVGVFKSDASEAPRISPRP